MFAWNYPGGLVHCFLLHWNLVLLSLEVQSCFFQVFPIITMKYTNLEDPLQGSKSVFTNVCNGFWMLNIKKVMVVCMELSRRTSPLPSLLNQKRKYLAYLIKVLLTRIEIRFSWTLSVVVTHKIQNMFMWIIVKILQVFPFSYCMEKYRRNCFLAIN